MHHVLKWISRDSLISKLTSYVLDGRISIPCGDSDFSLHHRVQTGSPIQWVLGALSPRVKRPRLEAGHSYAFSDDVKNASSYTSTPPIRL